MFTSEKIEYFHYLSLNYRTSTVPEMYLSSAVGVEERHR